MPVYVAMFISIAYCYIFYPLYDFRLCQLYYINMSHVMYILLVAIYSQSKLEQSYQKMVLTTFLMVVKFGSAMVVQQKFSQCSLRSGNNGLDYMLFGGPYFRLDFILYLY